MLFRAKRRDVDTDVARVLPIRNATEAALLAARDELSGLRRRLEETGVRAAFLFGDAQVSDTTGDSRAEARLKAAEQSIVRGQIRCRYIERQIAVLREISDKLDSIASPVTDQTHLAPTD